MDRHLVAVKVCVKRGTDQRMYFYGFTFDEPTVEMPGYLNGAV